MGPCFNFSDSMRSIDRPVSKGCLPMTYRSPPQELVGWDNIFICAGETVTARATLDPVSVLYWDDIVNK